MEDLRIAICDDDKLERTIMSDMLTKLAPNAELEFFVNGESFLENFKANKYDLIILDIYMTGITGVETLERIRRVDANVNVAFSTTSKDFALEGYRLHAVRYLEKPVSEDALKELLTLVSLQKLATPHLNIKVNSEIIDVRFNQIRYLEQSGHTTFIHLKDEVIKISGKLDDFEEKLDAPNFLRCHKSYLVNLDFVTDVEDEFRVFVMDNGDNVHVRRNDYASAKREFEKYLFTEARSQ